MTHFKTSNLPICPVDNTQVCHGPKCGAWRWKALSSNDPRFVSAVKDEMSRLYGCEIEKDPETKRTLAGFHKQAVANVNYAFSETVERLPDDLAFCGLGGPVT